ncbi:MAG: serine O-acetyltransferase [Epsilonproteobacteria bacterium]|nr:serine O-acetyltransferase [Campylobacterota bacterium]
MTGKINLWQQIKEDFSQPLKNDPAINSKVELFFNYPGVWAIVNYRFANILYKKGFKRIARIIMGINQFITNIDIHPCATIGRRVFLDHAIGVVIGATTIIENDILIYQGVTLGGVSLKRDQKRHPTIKSGAVIGAGAKVLGNIIIGENCRIGSNSVVINSVADNSTAVGIPARVIKKGRDKNPMAHNKIPDINKELFLYLFKRIKVLETAVNFQHKDKKLIEDDKDLEAIYKQFIKSVKE